jgi:hypothetical protein
LVLLIIDGYVSQFLAFVTMNNQEKHIFKNNFKELRLISKWFHDTFKAVIGSKNHLTLMGKKF